MVAIKAKIISVKIARIVDNSPDSSHLGEFSNHASEWYVDREAGQLRDDNGAVLASHVYTDYDRNQFPYIVGFQHNGSAGEWSHVDDAGVAHAFMHVRYQNNGRQRRERNGFAEHGVSGWDNATTRASKIRCLDIFYCCDDAERLEHLSRGDWSYLGIVAKAEILLSNGVTQTIQSSGLWGIESDAGDYFAEVEKEELADLRGSLKELGFSDRSITRAFAEREESDEA